MFRYKMTCEYTWPNHLMSTDQEAVEAIVNQHSFEDDVAYGHTKLFVRTPRTLFTLEQERAALIPILVLFLQKVTNALPSLSLSLCMSVSWGVSGLYLCCLLFPLSQALYLCCSRLLSRSSSLFISMFFLLSLSSCRT